MYYVVQDWMVQKLKLKGLDLSVFAIIYGFSQNKEAGVFNGSLNYIANATGYDRTSICRSLKFLTEKNLLFKKGMEAVGNRVLYKVNHKFIEEMLIKCQQSVDKMSTEVLIKCQQTVDKMSTDNIDIIKDNKEREREEPLTLKKENQETDGADKDKKDFEFLLIQTFENLTAKMATDVLQLDTLKTLENRNTLFKIFINRNYDHREAIFLAFKNARYKSGSKWLNFLENLRLLLRDGTLDGKEFIKKYIRPEKQKEIEKQKAENQREKEAEEAEHKKTEQLIFLKEAAELGLTIDEFSLLGIARFKKMGGIRLSISEEKVLEKVDGTCVC